MLSLQKYNSFSGVAVVPGGNSGWSSEGRFGGVCRLSGDGKGGVAGSGRREKV